MRLPPLAKKKKDKNLIIFLLDFQKKKKKKKEEEILKAFGFSNIDLKLLAYIMVEKDR